MAATFVPTWPHIAAMADLLTDAGLVTLLGGEGDPDPPCVVLWPAPGEPTAGSLADPTSDLIVEMTTVACGMTIRQAVDVFDRINKAMSRAVPVIAGRTVHPVRFVDAITFTRDDSLATPIWSTPIRWRLVSTPL